MMGINFLRRAVLAAALAIAPALPASAIVYLDFKASAAGCVAGSTEYTTPGTNTISIPSGCTAVTIECIAGGGGSFNNGLGGQRGGGGGEYAQKTSYSVSGLTGIYISVPSAPAARDPGGNCFAKENTSGGTTIALANGGGAGTGGSGGAGGTGGTGDVLHAGGSGSLVNGGPCGGGGAGGPTTTGGNASGATGGTSGGSPAGAGGSSGAIGNNYGGGSGSSTGGQQAGTQGWLKLTWS